MNKYIKSILATYLFAQTAVAAAPAFVDSFINTKFSKEEVEEGTNILLDKNYKEVGTYQNKNRIAFAPYDSSLKAANLPAESLLIHIDSTGAFTCYKKEIWQDSVKFEPSKKQIKGIKKNLDQIVN